MKVNLLLDNPGGVRSGHVNVDPLAPDGCADGRLRCELHDLAPLVDANEASELVALDVVDRYPPDQVDGVLDHWLSRLAHGGRLSVSAVDAGQACRAFLSGALTLEALNALVHGDGRGPKRQSLMTVGRLAEALAGKGVRVLSKRVADGRAVVVCERP